MKDCHNKTYQEKKNLNKKNEIKKKVRRGRSLALCQTLFFFFSFFIQNLSINPEKLQVLDPRINNKLQNTLILIMEILSI